MSAEAASPAPQGAVHPVTLHPLDELAAEASRQLAICNACRYCEGICAVYPALERRTLLDSGDISHLANLCHDCRACYDACMYVPPHDFAINIPKALAAVRLEDYRNYTWPARPPRLLSGRTGLFSGAIASVTLLLFVAVINAGFGGLVSDRAGVASPYDLIPYPVLLILMLIPAVYTTVVAAVAGLRFWRATSPSRQPLAARPAARALWDALTLRYLRGGGADCTYPAADRPSPRRRQLHALTAYGFGLCVASTTAAAVMQDFLGIEPPYPLLSAPVLLGIAGGVGLTAGSAGLIALKTRAAPVMSVAEMTIKDYGLLSALTFLGISGLATLLTRSTPAFSVVLLIHLAAVMLTFAAAPYSKLIHVVYRFLALVRDRLEQAAALDGEPPKRRTADTATLAARQG